MWCYLEGQFYEGCKTLQIIIISHTSLALGNTNPRKHAHIHRGDNKNPNIENTNFEKIRKKWGFFKLFFPEQKWLFIKSSFFYLVIYLIDLKQLLFIKIILAQENIIWKILIIFERRIFKNGTNRYGALISMICT